MDNMIQSRSGNIVPAGYLGSVNIVSSESHSMLLTSLPFTQQRLKTLLDKDKYKEDQDGILGNRSCFNNGIFIRLSETVYYRMRRISESINYENSNKTKKKTENKNIDSDNPTCCQCGKDLCFRVVTLLMCSHIICLECTPTEKSDANGVKIYQCPFQKRRGGEIVELSRCQYESHVDKIHVDEGTENVSIEGVLNCSVQNIPSIEENMLCQLFINDEYTDIMTLRSAVNAYYSSRMALALVNKPTHSAQRTLAAPPPCILMGSKSDNITTDINKEKPIAIKPTLECSSSIGDWDFYAKNKTTGEIRILHMEDIITDLQALTGKKVNADTLTQVDMKQLIKDMEGITKKTYIR
ncbi:MAG: hypothetical protein KAG53_10510 [Endozoicomonadaceae bacterium]|nr:hypothetical protein [Endozoicomonadaceae bacterium]